MQRCLFRKLPGGEISSDIIDIYPEAMNPFKVTLNKTKIDSLIGKAIGNENVKKMLEGLEMKIISENDENFELLVPAYGLMYSVMWT
ncbi:MAG: hypothetical protein QM751_09820 [Paludibacteraceae bacterium]